MISTSIIYLLAMKIYKLIMVSSFDSYSLFRENYWYVNYNKNKQCVHLFTFKSLFMVNFFILARYLSPSILMYSTRFRKSFSKVTCYLIYETSPPSLIFLLLHFLRLRSPSSTTSFIYSINHSFVRSSLRSFHLILLGGIELKTMKLLPSIYHLKLQF